MKNIDIIKAYTNGEKTVEQANKELKENGAGYFLNPQKNVLTAEEVLSGSAGLLDSGTGSFDKVQIDLEKMELVNCDMGEAYALCIVKGKTYEVKGKKLVEQ